ncbi:MAG: thiamine pyrophosphate-binding protein [Dehalococcoidia bacterium]|nr:thiamine pyrophosphate-binding protein [Dehalococcoidia bacterium]
MAADLTMKGTEGHMKLAEMIVKDAKDRGLSHFFGIPGGGAPLDMMEAGRRHGLQFVSVSHESSAALMAGYHGEMHGTAGLALSVKGVGAGNLTGGATNAYFERLPVVCLCECSPTSVHQKDMVQHCDHASMFGGITKYRATLGQDAPETLREAVFSASDGRPGPVLLNLPSDLGLLECGPAGPAMTVKPGAPPAAERLAAFKTLLGSARKPLVIAGADVIRGDARPELLAFINNIEAAVMVTMDARGVFPESNPRWAGVLMGTFGPNIIETEMLGRADIIVLVGVDSMMSHAPWKSDIQVIELSARAEYHSMAPDTKVRVDGDLKSSFKALADQKQPGFTENEIGSARRKVLQQFVRPGSATLAAHDVIKEVRAALPEEGTLFTETGAFVCLLEHVWPVNEPGTYYGTSGGRTMGLMLPAILGAKLARPDLPMIGIGADGSLLMRLGELEVFARTGISVPLVIINDRSLGTMKSRQKSRGLPDYGLDLQDVDFAKVAQACGLNGATARTPEELRQALKVASSADRTTLIDARVDPQAYQDSFGPMIGVLAPR